MALQNLTLAAHMHIFWSVKKCNQIILARSLAGDLKKATDANDEGTSDTQQK